MPGDHFDIPFVEARTQSGGPAYTPGRPDGPPLWIVIHDMEYPERDNAAEWTANYFATGAGGRSVSSHYTADNTSIIQCVRLGDSAWTVGNRPGNYRGINWELAGYASQTREQWLDPYGRAMLDRAATIMLRDMATYAIPARLLTDAQVAARVKGVTSHAQLGRVFGGTDHTDPGKNFPWDYLMGLLGGDMPTAEEIAAAVMRYDVDPDATARYTAGGVLWVTMGRTAALAKRTDELADRLLLIEEKLDRLLSQGGAGGVTLAQVEELLNRAVTVGTVSMTSSIAVRPPASGSGS